MEEFALIYGLQSFKGAVTYFYPEPFVAKVMKGKPSYFEKQGNDEVLFSYGFDISGTGHEEALKMCRSLHPSVLMAEYNKGKKKPASLEQLFEDKRWSSVIRNRAYQKLIRFLSWVRQHEFDLYFQVERKIFLEDIRLKFAPLSLKPTLRFDKTALGTQYYMFLNSPGGLVKPVEHNIEIITESPLLIINDGVIYEVEDINGLRLKPFLKQESIFIPERLTSEYFQKFIKDVAAQATIETVGFEFLEMKPDAKGLIRFTESFDGNGLEAALWYYYDECRFAYTDAQMSKVFIKTDDQNQIKVEKVSRNSAQERKMVTLIKQLGLVETVAKRWERANSQDPFETFYTLLDAKDRLSSAKISLELPEWEGKRLYAGEFSIEELHAKLNQDWFDLNLVIIVGDEEIPFKSLLQHIKNGNRFYALQSGEVFIIPITWFEQYEQLAAQCDLAGALPKLAKSRFSVLEPLGIKPTSSELIKVDFKVPSAIQAMLRPYQRQGAEWLVNHYSNGLGACLADDMGLGKTLQTLTLLCFVKENLVQDAPSQQVQLSLFDVIPPPRTALRALIVVPSSLAFNWMYEIKKFAPSLVATVHAGTTRSKDVRTLKEFDIIVTSYSILLKDHGLLSKIEFNCIILDEAHYIKNRNSKIFEAVRTLKTEQRVSLSGTPIENSLADLWAQMEFINPDILGSYPEFKRNYQDPIEKSKDEEALNELKLILGPYILRRTRKEVLKDLPDLEEQVFYSVLPDPQMDLIEKEKSKARNELLQAEMDQQPGKLHVLNALLKLRQLANHPKLADPQSVIESGKFDDVLETMETLVKSGNKILVFSSFVSHLKLYEDELKLRNIKYVILTGSDQIKDRELAVNRFQTDEKCPVFMISLKAGGTGLNLTSANYVLILDPWWNPFAESQAIGRSYRMGQSKKVTVIRFLAKDTIEEKIHALQLRKKDLAGQMMEEEMIPALDQETLEYLLA